MSSSRIRGRAATIAVLAGATVVLAAVPAFAHVTVTPNTAVKGGYSTVTVKVPNEEDSASTTKVEVNLPADHPIASVSIQLTKSKLAKPLTSDDGTINEAVTKITWSGGKIAPGQFQQFPVSLGPLPQDTDSLVFKALQTYDNGDIVRWIDVAQQGQPEPQHPAPVLKLTAATTTDGASATPSGAAGAADTKASGSSDSPAATAQAASSGSDDSDGTARALGVAGIVVGAIGVGYGVFAGRRRNPSA
jgi:uncharacterized protein YcnI